ncbi:sigma-54-dependent Fis family transcriptional regulator [Marinobacterium zhoushanense]|uniref:Sigma-54-dependent Fis family transcriptional regulator n=1 Tax=Marinobacterium zhoushanense TaxID=1679163 RepID=A0ABQ1KGK8_9GAMM|nr:sigma-54-dependent Fis family transcriptional regulator [Marinobacterium zhoushanense]GGB98454.1 sigma-54-dependent Fis family transcriptional regulator [Marinobacterium zhoushanense]
MSSPPPGYTAASLLQANEMPAGDSDNLGTARGPSVHDLSECLFFSPSDGRIWLDGQRMVLMHNSSLGSLRRELIERLGLERARGLLTRAGYSSGVRDAQLVRERWPDADPEAIFYAGTQLHSLEGVVQVETVHFEFDPRKGTYDGEFLWHHSSEDDEHIAAYGIGTEPACWMQLGYAMGYVTTLLGRMTVFREVECRSMGHTTCRVIGRTVELWGDVEEDLRYLNAEDFVSHSSLPLVSATPLPDSGSNELPPLGERQMIGVSSSFIAACHMLRRVATTRATVLFTGESGVGKELFARMLHEIGSRKAKPFVAINCAAIPDTLIESELFGVERGAFTGATISRPGRFERANGGTLFLDEIGTLSPSSQGKLLRVLQEGVVERVGGIKEIAVDVRVVAATNVELRDAVARGEFREDLFFRLNVFPIPLPPLRERRDDIPLLLSHFLRHYNQLHERSITGFTLKAMRALLNYHFPGNVRELQNLVERGVIAAEDNSPIDLPHLFRDEETTRNLLFTISSEGELASDGNEVSALEQFQRFAPAGKEGPSLDRLEARLVREAVEQAGGNLSAAARLLGLTRSRLAYRMKKLDEQI